MASIAIGPGQPGQGKRRTQPKEGTSLITPRSHHAPPLMVAVALPSSSLPLGGGRWANGAEKDVGNRGSSIILKMLFFSREL